jgi:type IX secretion system PorP/SprF family membrane protein
MKQIFLFIFATCYSLLTSQAIFAQFLPQSQQGLTNLVLLNPAAMSVGEEKFEATFSNQSIVAGGTGTPSASFFNAQGTIWHRAKKNYLSLGTIIVNDRIGNFSNVLAQGGAAFHLNQNQNHHLSFGIYAGAIRYSFDMNRAIYTNPNEPVAGIGINGSSAVIDFGSYYEFKKRGLFAMLSGRWISGYTVVTENKFPFGFSAMLGQHFNLTDNKNKEETIMLTCAVEVRKETALSASFHTIATWKQNIWVGTILRAEAMNILTAVGWQAGFRFKADEDNAFGLRFAYFMPMGNQLATRYSQGIMEIGINYQLHKASKY